MKTRAFLISVFFCSIPVFLGFFHVENYSGLINLTLSFYILYFILSLILFLATVSLIVYKILLEDLLKTNDEFSIEKIKNFNNQIQNFKLTQRNFFLKILDYVFLITSLVALSYFGHFLIFFMLGITIIISKSCMIIIKNFKPVEIATN